MKRVVKLISDPSYQMVLGDRPLVYLFNVQDDWLKAWAERKAHAGYSMSSGRCESHAAGKPISCGDGF